MKIKLIKLKKCTKRVCSHVFSEDETDYKPISFGERAICPECGCESFYELNEKGQEIKWADREEYRNGIDPMQIQPSKRMGVEMTRKILKAKLRILNSI